MDDLAQAASYVSVLAGEYLDYPLPITVVSAEFKRWIGSVTAGMVRR
jgi:hypothetical protein